MCHETIVAAWNGTLEKGYLTYAAPEHPEHRRYSRDDRDQELVLDMNFLREVGEVCKDRA